MDTRLLRQIRSEDARLAELEAEIVRLRNGLSLVMQGAHAYGAAWCKAQARSALFNLDFDAYPETGKPETEPA
jgi:hypothetical protein